MKRKEKMSKDEIINVAKGFIDCDNCVMNRKCDGSWNCAMKYDEYMEEEIEMIPRAWKFKTVEEANTAFCECCKQQTCSDCKYYLLNNNGTSCKFNWLYEEVEK